MNLNILQRRPILFRVLLVIVLPCLIALVSLRLRFNASLPDQQYAQGSFAKYIGASITRDSRGVPDIIGTDLSELFFGLGLAHAQDRIWQMELLRRRAGGRLSEVFGYDKLIADKFSRTLGFYRWAEQDFQVLSPQTHALLKAYSDGVNHWLQQPDSLPIELRLTDIQPEPWSSIDSLAIWKLLAFEMSGSFRDDLLHFQLTQLFGLSNAEVLLSQYKSSSLLSVNAERYADIGYVSNVEESLLKLAKLEQDFALSQSELEGDVWAVSAELSANGRALLANTLNHPANIPATFYLANMQSPEMQLKGMTLPGVPAVLFGHNQHLAWGGNKASVKTQFLQVEQLGSQSADFEFKGKRLLLQEWRENIGIKADFPSALRNPLPDMQWAARQTQNGPLISDVLETSLPISLSWPGFSGKDRSFEAVLEISFADNWEKFRQASYKLSAPALTYLFADKQGNIGLQVAGDIPEQTNDWSCLVFPDEAEQISTYVASEKLPSEFNPEQGWLISKVSFADKASPLSQSILGDKRGQSWLAGIRQERIAQLVNDQISQGKKLSESTLATMQQDVFSPLAARLTPILLQQVPKSSPHQPLLERLRNWDYVTDKDSVPTTIYRMWLEAFGQALLLQVGVTNNPAQVKARKSVDWVQFLPQDYVYRVLNTEQHTLCGTSGCEELVNKALDSTVKQLTQLMGDDLDDWRWGDIHQIAYQHPFFGEVNILQLFFNRQISHGGGAGTINPGVSVYQPGLGFIQKQVSGYRSVTELDEAISMFQTIGTGQSSNVLSPWYDSAIHEHHNNESYAQ